MNPLGSAEALDENVKDDTPIVTRVYWKDKKGKEIIDELPETDSMVTLCAEVENGTPGESVEFTVEYENGHVKTVSGIIGTNGIVEVKGYDVNPIRKE
jgi:hypothetical protein